LHDDLLRKNVKVMMNYGIVQEYVFDASSIPFQTTILCLLIAELFAKDK